MRWGLLLVGLLLGFVGGFSSLIYLQARGAGGDTGEMAIMFDSKNYYDSDAFVAVSGTLTGPDMGLPEQHPQHHLLSADQAVLVIRD